MGQLQDGVKHKQHKGRDRDLMTFKYYESHKSHKCAEKAGDSWGKVCHKQDAAAAKLLQSCLTLCDPIDGSPLGSAVPGILQARTLEWAAISFSNEGK